MLPSTGYFNGINCPFYDSGLCDRPYCHFRHVKKDPQIANDGIESGAILQKLVSAAVQKVLQQTEANGISSTAQVPDVEVKANLNNTKATYNPTPISELNKINNTDAENVEDVNEQKRRHIPVPYTPRKPASLPIKRPAIDTNGSKPFIYVPPTIKYTPGSAENVETDKYTPPGAVDLKEKYLPGTEKELQEYTPNTNSPETASKRNYVPSSDKITNKSKLLEYKPSKVSVIPGKPAVTYQPTPRSLAPCFSSDEEEPDSKKRKVSNDLNGLDDLGAEFDILGQILDEEKSNDKERAIKSKEDPKKLKHSSSNNNKSDSDAVKKEKSESSKSQKSHKSKTDSKEKSIDKKEDRVKDKNRHKDRERDDRKKKEEKSSHKSSSKDDKKEKLSNKSSSKDEKQEKSSHKISSKDEKQEKSSHKSSSKDEKQEKSSHKSSSKDREKDKKENKSKHSSDKNKHSSNSHSPKSKHSSSRSSERHSDSKSSKKDSKSKDKHKDKSHKSSKKKDESKRKDDSGHEYIDENEIEEEIELSEDDEETIALECKKIFEEYVPEVRSTELEDISKLEDINITEEEYLPTKKRISRTIDKNIKIIPKPSLKPDFKVSAAQTMADRLAKVREYHSSQNQMPIVTEPSMVRPDLLKAPANAPSTGISKIRIAHVPYASTMVSAKKTISPAQSAKSLPSTSSTICQTVKRGAQRVAHVPSEKFIDRPGVLEPLGSKIPANIRSTYLNMMIDESLKLYISVTDAYARAQNEELNTSKKCYTVPIYKNSAAMAVSRLRRELQESNGVKKPSETSGTQSNSTGTWSIEGRNKKPNEKEFTGARFYENIKKWILTEEQLRENGFPRPHQESVEKGRATIYVRNNKQKPPKGYLRTCCRCKKEYTVNKKGFAAVKDECIYHPNNKYRVRGEARYQCCSQDTSSDGCCIAPSHVYEYVDYDHLRGYVRTLPPEREKDDYGIYALDCEMCYTTHGLDLTRVTVINSACKVVYETLIKPIHPIIDYNTRYSGITEEQMSRVRTTLIEVQATLLAMFNSKTILVGHSLESDFKALKLIHDTVVDTSVLFPHKMGPPYKRALRNLSSEHLKKIIQNSVEGHDSAEDAMVCMELINYKLKEDLKTR